MAVGAQNDTHRDRRLERVPDAGGHAPADQVATVPHRARFRISLLPAERRRALAVAFAQCLAAEWPINILIAFRIAAQAKFEWIDLERNRKLVHRAFKRVHAGGGAWTAHIARCRKVEFGEFMRVLCVGARIEHA